MEVRGQAEGDGFRVAKGRFLRAEGRDKLAAPDVAVRARYGQFVWVALRHVHGVGEEGEAGELVAEMTTEEPEVGVLGVCGLEIV